jgi:hypothetical protein
MSLRVCAAGQLGCFVGQEAKPFAALNGPGAFTNLTPNR